MNRWFTKLHRLCLRSPLRLRIVVAILVGGVLAGFAGALLTLLLHLVQHIAFGYTDLSFVIGVGHASRGRRLVAPVVGAAVCGLGWLWLRPRWEISLARAASARADRLSILPTWADAILQIGIVGSGASIGREAAPRQAAASVVSGLTTMLALPARMRRVLVGAAAGAGLGAVYNVPLSGALFAMEVLGLGFRDPLVVAICLAMSFIATVVAWPAVTRQPTYSYPPIAGVPVAVWLWTPVAILGCLFVARYFSALVRIATRLRPAPNRWLPIVMCLGAAGVGLLSWWWPEIPGNGKGIVQLTMLGTGTALGYAVLTGLKPAATAISMGTGASGGVLTPALASGAAFGAAVSQVGAGLGRAWPMAAFALVAAVGVLAVTQGSPWFAAVFGWELAHPSPLMIVPLLLAALGAYHLDAAINRRRSAGAKARRSG